MVYFIEHSNYVIGNYHTGKLCRNIRHFIRRDSQSRKNFITLSNRNLTFYMWNHTKRKAQQNTVKTKSRLKMFWSLPLNEFGRLSAYSTNWLVWDSGMAPYQNTVHWSKRREPSACVKYLCAKQTHTHIQIPLHRVPSPSFVLCNNMESFIQIWPSPCGFQNVLF